MENFGIAKIDEEQSAAGHILLACSLASAADIAAPRIGPAGSLVGTGQIFQDGGFTPGAGSVYFPGIDPNNLLKHEGQIVLTISTRDVVEYDKSNYVSRSIGYDRLAQTIFQLRDSLNAAAGSLAISAVQRLALKLHASDALVNAYSATSVGRGDYVELCCWWRGNKFGLLLDGMEIFKSTRTNFSDNVFNRIYVGAGGSGLTNPISLAIIKNIIISRRAPRVCNADSVGFFGDSFVANLNADCVTPRWNNNRIGVFAAVHGALGKKIGRVISHGYGGYSVCDTGASDLSAKIAEFAATLPEVAVIVAGNNDSTASASNVTNASTGTDSNYKSFIQQIAANKRCKRIIVCTPGSLRQDYAINNESNNINLGIVYNIIKALPSWWDSQNPDRKGLVVVYDLFEALGGDSVVNYNYQGQYDLLGNATVAPVALPENRHPSSEGALKILTDLARMVI